MTQNNSALRVARGSALLLAAWVAFFSMQSLMSIALAKPGALNRAALLETDFVLGVLWSLFSVAIVFWHRRARALTSNLFVLIALHVPLLVALAAIDVLVSRVAWRIFTHTMEMAPFAASALYYADFDIVSYLVVVAVAETLTVRRALQDRQRTAKQLESSLNRARLDYLEAQLQPHFLFNSLGAVSELAYDAPATASRVLRQLTAIFRTALAKKADEVTLGEEIVGIEPYLDIQRIRFADWLTIDYHVDDAAVDCLLPRFVLQPLVENAIRHGLSGRSAPGRIDISASLEGDALLVRVTDNGVGLDSKSSVTGRGIGLANVRDRLAILYGSDDLLRLTSNATGGAMAELRVPARHRADASEAGRLAEETGVAALHESELPAVSVPAFMQRPSVAIAFTWLCCGLLWTQESFLSDLLHSRPVQSTWLEIVRTDMTSALIWALLTPPILYLAKHCPIRRENIVGRSALFFLFALLVPLIHVPLWQQLSHPELPITAPAWRLQFPIDFVIFWVIIAIGHRRVFTDWLHAREAAAVVLSSELAAAQERAAKLQGIPRVLLHSLDGIADTVRRDPSLTERQLTRLADYLRIALESTDERGMTPERERALDAAVAALRDSGAYPLDLTLTA